MAISSLPFNAIEIENHQLDQIAVSETASSTNENNTGWRVLLEIALHFSGSTPTRSKVINLYKTDGTHDLLIWTKTSTGSSEIKAFSPAIQIPDGWQPKLTISKPVVGSHVVVNGHVVTQKTFLP